MGERHKWAEVIIAYAEGKAIQFNDLNGNWHDWKHPYFPRFEDGDWRIKPAEPVVRWQWIVKSPTDSYWKKTPFFLTDAEADNHFFSITKRFKDEASRVEFPAEENA